jgi:hypothetical protein
MGPGGVEVAAGGNGRVYVRDGKVPTNDPIELSAQQWRGLLESAKSGGLDSLVAPRTEQVADGGQPPSDPESLSPTIVESAQLIIESAVKVLPAEWQERYAEEYLAYIYAKPPAEQIRIANSLADGIWPVREELIRYKTDNC